MITTTCWILWMPAAAPEATAPVEASGDVPGGVVCVVEGVPGWVVDGVGETGAARREPDPQAPATRLTAMAMTSALAPGVRGDDLVMASASTPPVRAA
jgi:hypothetical protein